ncbi:HlyU family transcriptional regulator [Phytohalomonas tamaricis]|uniref:HlyU family transcriptional regulator n=1 Tax=Phytohalomonas tamaricis TaxID=2081032 RepID=UPI000D0BD84F|nr:HlyU family transcriptional regulator [Phytohalomonas tamaricis]
MMKRLLAGLLGNSGGQERSANKKKQPEVDPIDYKGFLITPDPQDANGQYRVSGWIRKSVAGEMKEHRFERSDTVPDRDGCNELMVRKAERFIEDHGERMFER